jgi:hypothetical protein
VSGEVLIVGNPLHVVYQIMGGIPSALVAPSNQISINVSNVGSKQWVDEPWNSDLWYKAVDIVVVFDTVKVNPLVLAIGLPSPIL